MPRPERSWSLTPEQYKLAGFLAGTELTVPLIARRMEASPSTTRFRIQSLYERVGVSSRREFRDLWMAYEFASVEGAS